jgi:hypothetical protein
MGNIRLRDSSEIRAQALRFAVKKHDEGCVGCAEGYIRLAHQHGATSADFARAAMGRRGFLKLAATAVMAASAAGELLLAPRARASKIQMPTTINGYFGVDSCTTPEDGAISAMPLQYYIGELGATANGLACFNIATAEYVGIEYTHGYWGLCGPTFAADGGFEDPATYGASQAAAAIAAWNANHHCAGKTIFADVEEGFGGWGGLATPQDHAAMLDAFLRGLAQEGFVPGVYISESAKVWFPPEYRSIVPFAYWVAGGPHAGEMCGPCADQCYTLGPVEGFWQETVSQTVFGGQRAVLWQYWLSGFGCNGDFNYSPQDAKDNFVPDPLPIQQ